MKPLALLALLLALGACQDPSSPSPVGPAHEPSAAFAAKAHRGDPIPGQYIVVFRGDVQSTESVAKALAGKHKGKLKHTYKAALKGMAVQLSDAEAMALRQDPAVEYVEQDQVAYAIAEPIVQPGATAGLDRIDQRSLPLSGTYSYTADGTGVRVYIIDTGIEYSHREFGGRRAFFGFDAIGIDGTDCNGHGTHVAGTVGGATYGVAKNVSLYSVRVLNCEGNGSYSQVIAGVDWVTANRRRPAVANMSLGGGLSTALNQAVTKSIATGITYAIAAGNSADDACFYSPASTSAALTVAATDVRDRFAPFSNYGRCVDIDAPGVDITSAWIGGFTATRTISGTSMASPHVAGAAALYLSTNSSGTPTQVAAALTGGATTGILTAVPAGTPNRLLHTGNTNSGSWSNRAGLPSGRRGFAAAVATGQLYAIGGFNGVGTAVSSVVAYNPSTNSWSTKAALPAARRTGNGAATIAGTIYLAGGQDAGGALTRTLYAYNSSTNTWSTRASMPVVSSCGGSAVISGKLYVFSGCTRSSTGAQVSARLLHRYDPSTNSWTALRSAPAVHFQPAVSVIGGKLYVVGGKNDAGVATGLVDMYDPATNTWSRKAPMPTARFGTAAAVVGGRLHVIGGQKGTSSLNTVEAYDPVTGSWSARAGMPTARAALGAGVINQLLYAIGGSSSTVALSTNERFTP